MTAWTSDELNRIGNAEELQIAALRSDGTLRKLVTIRVVRLGDGFEWHRVNTQRLSKPPRRDRTEDRFHL